MRILEPNHYNHKVPMRTGRLRISKKFLLLAAVMILLIAGGVAGLKLYILPAHDKSSDQSKGSVQQQNTTPTPDTASTNEQPAPPAQKTLRQFAGNDFKNFYDQLQLPNLLPVENPPVISGNDVADARIRQIAESRGYRLRSSPSGSLATVDGMPVQPSVVDSWTALKAAAAAQGLQMSIVSSYRSVDNQRSLFMSRLANTGATIEQVAAGSADDKVNTVLITSSIPGYSKHHTGYTLDLLCAGWEFENFKNSPCHTWLMADNYKVAKENGFIPSYPDGADIQGPDPEAWEYVWVGADRLYN